MSGQRPAWPHPGGSCGRGQDGRDLVAVAPGGGRISYPVEFSTASADATHCSFVGKRPMRSPSVHQKIFTQNLVACFKDAGGSIDF